MFPERSDHVGQAMARAICATCPVIGDCREHAIGTNEQYGTWAGMTYVEIRQERRRRGLDSFVHEHGTRARYQHQNCRCEPCVLAARTYERERKRRHRIAN
jgi:hypothetical protein